MNYCYIFCIIFILVLLSAIVPIFINVDKYNEKRLKIYFNFLQPIIIVAIIILSIIFLTGFSNKTENGGKRVIESIDKNITCHIDIKSKLINEKTKINK